MKLELKKTVEVKTAIEIKPCPFCGCDDLDAGSFNTGNGCDRFGGVGYVACGRCGAKIEEESNNVGWGDTTLEGLLKKAIAKWNRRI